jgi:hypothetical protein
MADNPKNIKLSKQDEDDVRDYQAAMKNDKDKLDKGPIMERQCTDKLCCLLFVVFVVGFVGILSYGLANGDPDKLAISWDSDSRGCGYTAETADYPFLYWPRAPTPELIENIGNGDLTEVYQFLQDGTCVKTCPVADGKPIECMPTTNMVGSSSYTLADGTTSCAQLITAQFLESIGISLTEYQAKGLNTAGDNFAFRYDTTPVGGFCMPDLESGFESLKEAGESLVQYLYSDILGDYGTNAMADIFAAQLVIFSSAVTALIFGYIFLMIIRCIGGFIIYVCIAMVILGTIAGGLFVQNYAATRQENDSYNEWLEYAAYGLFGLAALEFLCVCCCWSAIKLAIAVQKTTSQYVSQNLRIQLLPLFSWVLLGVWIIIWTFAVVHIWSIGDVTQRAAPLSFMTEIMWEENTRYMLLYQLFGLFWIAAFINGLCQFIIAASACMWYFSVASDTKGRGTVGTGFYWGFRYHMGTIAFGSFCIAVIQTIRVLFEWYRRAMAKASGDNKVVKVLICLTRYCLYILEKCVKYISKNAYIQTALTNKNFCSAAWSAFALILANAGRFGWSSTVGAILNYFGVLAIAATNALIAYVVLVHTDYFEVTSPIWPVVIVGIISLLIANTFLSIFGFASDAILQSFLLDEQLRFAGANRPEHMQELAKTLETGNKGSSCC